MNKTIENAYAKYDGKTNKWESHNRITKGVGIDSFNSYSEERVETEKLMNKSLFEVEKMVAQQKLNKSLNKLIRGEMVNSIKLEKARRGLGR